MLTVENVTVQFGGLVAVNQVNLDVKQHEIVGLIGPNGAGKTTLFNSITGIYKPSSGKILYQREGTDEQLHVISHLSTHAIVHRGIARTFQNVRLFKNMTVIENVLIGVHSKMKSGLFASLFRTSTMKEEESRSVEYVYDLLKYFNLENMANTIASSLPFGSQKVLEIVRALAGSPSLLLLDEPAAGLNTQETMMLIKVLERVSNDFKPSIFLIEHDMKFVMELSQRIYVLDYGELIAHGTPAEIQKNEKVITAYLGESLS